MHSEKQLLDMQATTTVELLTPSWDGHSWARVIPLLSI